MKRWIAAVFGIACLVAAATAYAADPTTSVFTLKTTTKATKGGTKAKPVPFTGLSFDFREGRQGGGRPVAPETVSVKWKNVVIDNKGFPVCTAETIDAAQSDAGCPKGSLVFEGPTGALIGPSGQPNSNVDCQGKSVRLYNGEPGKMSLLLIGSGAKCAGLGYAPPMPIVLKSSSSGTTLTVLLPESVRHPLPGVDGSLTVWAGKFFQRTKKVGKKTSYMFSSQGCTGTRTLTVTVTDEEGTHPTTVPAGKCLK